MPIRPDPGYKWTDLKGNKYKVGPEDGNKFTWNPDEPPMDLAQWLMLVIVILLAIIGVILNDVHRLT